MSSNFFKSSAVITEGGVRVINSNELVAKKLEQIVQAAQTEPMDDFVDSFSEGIDAAKAAVLLDDDTNYIAQTSENEEKGDNKASVQMASKAASDLLQQANEEAKQIVSDAQREAETIKKEAFENASQQGYEEGKRRYEQQLEQGQQELAHLQKQLENEFSKKVEELEPQFIDTLSGIYEHIFKVDLSDRKEILVHLIHQTLCRQEASKSFLIHVSREDYPYILMQKKELVNATGINAESIEIIEDFAMQKNHCIIENDGGIFDCSLDTQLEQLRKELLLLSYQ